MVSLVNASSSMFSICVWNPYTRLYMCVLHWPKDINRNCTVMTSYVICSQTKVRGPLVVRGIITRRVWVFLKQIFGICTYEWYKSFTLHTLHFTQLVYFSGVVSSVSVTTRALDFYCVLQWWVKLKRQKTNNIKYWVLINYSVMLAIKKISVSILLFLWGRVKWNVCYVKCWKCQCTKMSLLDIKHSSSRK